MTQLVAEHRLLWNEVLGFPWLHLKTRGMERIEYKLFKKSKIIEIHQENQKLQRFEILRSVQKILCKMVTFCRPVFMDFSEFLVSLWSAILVRFLRFQTTNFKRF